MADNLELVVRPIFYRKHFGSIFSNGRIGFEMWKYMQHPPTKKDHTSLFCVGLNTPDRLVDFQCLTFTGWKTCGIKRRLIAYCRVFKRKQIIVNSLARCLIYLECNYYWCYKPSYYIFNLILDSFDYLSTVVCSSLVDS